MNGFKW